MAISLKINACLSSGCSTMTISDVTGIYNANTNTTGWESPNLQKSNVASATLEIEGPTQTSFTSFDVTAAITSSSVYVEEFPLVEIAYSDMTLSPNFIDGLYNFIYTVIDNSGNEYIKKKTSIFLCNAQCCLDKAKADLVNICGCCEQQEKMKSMQLADSLIQGMLVAGNCLTSDQIKQNLVTINRVCKDKGSCCE